MSDRIVLAHRIAESDTTLDPFGSLHDTIVFSSADWGEARDLAWMYGIVVGWGADESEPEEESALSHLAEKFGWSPQAVQRLERLHAAFLAAQRTHNDAGRTND